MPGSNALEFSPVLTHVCRVVLDRFEGNGVRLVLIEVASRFVRLLIVQKTGLVALGVRAVTAIGDHLANCSDPMREMMRQITGAVVQAEQKRLVA